MFWSISESKTFTKCQRQWYYKHCVANANATKNPQRRRAYLLSKLQTISGWRGQLVDTIISTVLIPSLNSRRQVSTTTLIRLARALYDRQLECARRHPIKDGGFAPKDEGDAFAVFYSMQYGGCIDEEELSRAWADIEHALDNLMRLERVQSLLNTAHYLIPQRPLSFDHSGMTVRAVPDLIGFRTDAPPFIIDWKVHSFGIREAWLQLGTYAIALSRTRAHKDFPPHTDRWDPTTLNIIEVQLLTSSVREHGVTTDDVDSIDAYIADSVTQMLLALDGRATPQLKPDDFLATAFPENCGRCPFRCLCWEGDSE